MIEVVINVNDRPYSMVCEDGEEKRLKQLARIIDSEVIELKKTIGHAGDNRLLVMAALVIADKLTEQVDRVENLQKQLANLQQQMNKQENYSPSDAELAGKIEDITQIIEDLSIEISGRGSNTAEENDDYDHKLDNVVNRDIP